MESDRQIGLSLEQQFTLRAFEEQIKNASLEQAKALLYDLYRQLLLRETYFKDSIKQSLLPDFPCE